MSENKVGTNTGHGHVWKRTDGLRAKCGGPAICSQCAKDKAIVDSGYPAQPVQAAVPYELPSPELPANPSENDADELWVTRSQYVKGWNDCRNAMLSAAPTPPSADQPTELELHRADYQACKDAGFESPGELLAAYKRLVKQADSAAVDPVAVVKLWNEGGSGEFKECVGINNLPDGAKLYMHPSTKPQRITEQYARAIGLSSLRFWVKNPNATVDAWLDDEYTQSALAKLNESREPSVPDNKFGNNIVWFLQEFANAEDDYLQDGYIEIFGESESGAEGSCEVSVKEICAEASKVIQSLIPRIYSPLMLENREPDYKAMAGESMYVSNETQIRPEVAAHIARQKSAQIAIDADLIGEDSRTQFHAWASEKGFEMSEIWSSVGEPFESEETRLAWDIWQASRAYLEAAKPGNHE